MCAEVDPTQLAARLRDIVPVEEERSLEVRFAEFRRDVVPRRKDHARYEHHRGHAALGRRCRCAPLAEQHRAGRNKLAVLSGSDLPRQRLWSLMASLKLSGWASRPTETAPPLGTAGGGAVPAEPEQERPRPRSYTAPEIAAMDFPDPDPVLFYFERGKTSDIVAKPKDGKTTFILLGIQALRLRKPFSICRPRRCRFST